MKPATALLALACIAAGPAFGQPLWFTVMGNTEDPGVTTILVDPVPQEVRPEGRVMALRINRSTERRNWENLPYRSYDATVLFDCNSRTAKYLAATFYMQPLWKGEPHKVMDYTKGPVRPMLFKDVEPNPTARIIRAACPAN